MMEDSASALSRARQAVEQVTDPEIPVLTIGEMGILRDVRLEDGALEVVITPTYSGCPAMAMIEVDIRAALEAAGCAEAKVTTVLSPPWTTDWMSPEAKEKLRAYGIAPPVGLACERSLFSAAEVVCPRCGSHTTERVSEFGSTACKALYRCLSCLEPFEYFKCL